jgi:hypothetical protein
MEATLAISRITGHHNLRGSCFIEAYEFDMSNINAWNIKINPPSYNLIVISDF